MALDRKSCPTCGATYPSNAEFCGIDGDKLVGNEADPMIGRTIGHYRIVEVIGDGGMARVYRAVHTFLEQECAVKLLFGELAADEAFTSRFRREALAASKIKHDNVVSILDFGLTDANLPFMVMEFVRGQVLSDALRGETPHPAEWITRTTRQIAAGLAEAHRMGFVHRDLKPGNVMLAETEDGLVAKILDFGLVHLSHGADSEPSRLTRQGQILGTPTYMAPEQISALTVTAKTDLYALGVILYEMLAGKPPFGGELAQVLTQHVALEPEPPPANAGLENIALALLSKSPDARPADADAVCALLDDVDRALRGSAPAPPRHRAPPPQSMPVVLPPQMKPKGPRVFVAGLIALALIGVLWLGYRATRPTATAEALAETSDTETRPPAPAKKTYSNTPKPPKKKPSKKRATAKRTDDEATTAKVAPTKKTSPTKTEAPVAKEVEPKRTPVRPAARTPVTTAPPKKKTDGAETTVTIVAPDGAASTLKKADVAVLKRRLDRLGAGKFSDTDESRVTRHRRAAIRAMARKDLSVADIELQRCLSIQPDNPDCHKLLAMIYEQRGSTKDAITHYRKYLKLAPDAADARSVAAIVKKLEAQ